MKKILTIIFAILVTFSANTQLFTQEKFEFSEINPNYTRAINSENEDNPDKSISKPLPFVTRMSTVNQNKTFPKSYDARTDNYVTSVKDQQLTNSCWTFSAIGNLETYLLKNYSLETDFSERHVEYSASYNFKDGKNPLGFWRNVDDGGNDDLSAAYFLRGSGPVLEEEMPYEEKNTQILLSAIDITPANVQVHDFMFQGINYDNNVATDSYEDNYIKNLKNLITNTGSASIGVLELGNEDYTNKDNFSHYNYNAKLKTDHAVLAVGWDDDYSKDNFLVPPAKDGAFIVKNSWGASWGNSGYFYLSYEDPSLYEMSAGILKATDEKNYDTMYSYDPLGTTGSIGYNSETGYSANVFTKTKGSQWLTEVVIATVGPTTYDIYVNSSGNDLHKLTYVTSGKFDYAGYTTITLPKPILLTRSKFTVAVKYTAKKEKRPIPIEYRIPKHIYQTATASPGESYISSNGIYWNEVSIPSQDYTNCNIKALTKKADIVVKKLSAPKVKLTNTSPMSIKLNWNKVANATGYSIYGSTSKNSGYLLIGRVNSKTLSFTSTWLATGKAYYYKVKANTDNGYYSDSDYSVTQKLTAKPKIPTGLKAKKLTSKSARISWTKTGGVTKYVVYRSTSEKGKYTAIGSTNSNNFNDVKRAANKKYYYKVRAYTTFNSKNVYGSYTDVIKV